MERTHHYQVYILECADGSYYTGVTNNLCRRLDEHQQGIHSKCYTFRRRPVKLVFEQDFNQIERAIAFEKQLKGWTRAKKEALIRGDLERLRQLAACANSTHYDNKLEPPQAESPCRPSTSLRVTRAFGEATPKNDTGEFKSPCGKPMSP